MTTQQLTERLEKLKSEQAMCEKQLAEIERSRQQLIANINAYNGAIQECEWWLKNDAGLPGSN